MPPLNQSMKLKARMRENSAVAGIAFHTNSGFRSKVGIPEGLSYSEVFPNGVDLSLRNRAPSDAAEQLQLSGASGPKSETLATL